MRNLTQLQSMTFIDIPLSHLLFFKESVGTSLQYIVSGTSDFGSCEMFPFILRDYLLLRRTAAKTDVTSFVEAEITSSETAPVLHIPNPTKRPSTDQYVPTLRLSRTQHSSSQKHSDDRKNPAEAAAYTGLPPNKCLGCRRKLESTAIAQQKCFFLAGGRLREVISED